MTVQPVAPSTTSLSGGIETPHGQVDQVRRARSSRSRADGPRVHTDGIRDVDGLHAGGRIKPGCTRPSQVNTAKRDKKDKDQLRPRKLRRGGILPTGEVFVIEFAPPRLKPCIDCPFWRDRSMHKSLGEERISEIIASIMDGGYFPCHKTTRARQATECEDGGWDSVSALDKLMIVSKERVCFGADNFKITGGWLEGVDLNVRFAHNPEPDEG